MKKKLILLGIATVGVVAFAMHMIEKGRRIREKTVNKIED